MVLLFNTLGAAAFAGFAALILLLALQTFCGIYLQGARRKVQQHTDARLAGICDALGGMRTLKTMVAEHTMQNSIGDARAREVSASMQWSFVQAAVTGIYAVPSPSLAFAYPFANVTSPPFFVPSSTCRPCYCVPCVLRRLQVRPSQIYIVMCHKFIIFRVQS